jgi:hypothetical protein
VAPTIVEIMLAIGIFMTAIYSIWIAILKGSRGRAAAEVQRSRITMQMLEDAFLTTNRTWAVFVHRRHQR